MCEKIDRLERDIEITESLIDQLEALKKRRWNLVPFNWGVLQVGLELVVR